jgi:hypothetical protein
MGSRLEADLRRAVPAERLFCFPASDEAGAGISTMKAASVDLDTPKECALPWPHRSRPERRYRRLDTLFARHDDVGMIILADPEGAHDIIGGAVGVMAMAPPLVLDLSALPVSRRFAAWSSVASALNDTYVWHDAMLQPTQVDCAVTDTLRDPVVVALPLAEAASGVAALAASGWASPIGDSKPIPTRLVTPFDAALPCWGFHSPERDGVAAWRWSGADPEHTFVLMLPGPGTWQIILAVADWGVVETAKALSVYANGAPLTLLDHGSDEVRFGNFVVTPDADMGRVVIVLGLPRPARLAPDDLVWRGIALTYVVLERVG